MPKTITEPSPITCPFTIVVDSNESAPWHFTGMPIDGDRHDRVYIVPIERQAMYRKGLADYSIKGCEQLVQIERKSLPDLFGTLAGRRDEFKAEIDRINSTCMFAAVVIEADFVEIAGGCERSQLSPKSVLRTIISWSIRYPRVHWFPCPSRRDAERLTFRLLEKFWQIHGEGLQAQ